MSPLNDGRLTGRFTINSGFVRYTPPMMSEKKFEFDEGSYVAFNGDMLNPILNIHATDRMKANVTQTGQNSRLINFDIALSVTNTLQNMNVAFDLSTDDDITVQNELASMSQQQRANQAMNLLLYNTYTYRHQGINKPVGKSAILVPHIADQLLGCAKHQRSRHFIRHRPIQPDNRRSQLHHHKLQLQGIEKPVQRQSQDHRRRQLLHRRRHRRELPAEPHQRYSV